LLRCGTCLKLTVQIEVAPVDGFSKQAVEMTPNAPRELGLEGSVREE